MIQSVEILRDFGVRGVDYLKKHESDKIHSEYTCGPDNPFTTYTF